MFGCVPSGAAPRVLFLPVAEPFALLKRKPGAEVFLFRESQPALPAISVTKKRKSGSIGDCVALSGNQSQSEELMTF